jgi:molecular chaperone GrpE
MTNEENNQNKERFQEQQNDSNDASMEQQVEPEQNVPTLEQQLEQVQAALEKEKKEYLFLMADFDNFRKRQIKEKADILKNAAEKTLAGILPIVDDFERGLDAIKGANDAESVKEGIVLIYNKLIKYLSENGVQQIESTGTDFDTELHEAIATIPSPTPELKGKVVDTTTKGYKLNDKVLRHAKVVVGE